MHIIELDEEENVVLAPCADCGKSGEMLVVLDADALTFCICSDCVSKIGKGLIEMHNAREVRRKQLNLIDMTKRRRKDR